MEPLTARKGFDEMMKRISALLKRIMNLSPLHYVALGAALSLIICAIVRFTFDATCTGQACKDQNGDISASIFGFGGIFFTAIALVPVFWVDSKLKDAREEVRRLVNEDVQKDIVNLIRAHLFLFRAHYDSQPGQLLADEGYIQEAVSLWPNAKRQEYPTLGKRFAKVALELNVGSISKVALPFNDAPFPSSTLYPLKTFYPIDLETAIKKAIFYLEESLVYSEAIDRDFLVALVCMYGFYPDRYEEMIRYMEQAIHLDSYVKEDFASYHALAMLSRACNRDRHRMERIGRKIDVELPMTRDSFLKTVQDINGDISHGHYKQVYVIKKTIGLSSNCFYSIRFSTYEKDGKYEVPSAGYQGSTNDYISFLEENESPISLEDFYDRISKQFYLITLKTE